jgi:uncharacterized protein
MMIATYNSFIKRTRKFVKKYMDNLDDISHDYNHINLVVNLALKIAKYEGIINKNDLFHIKMGALLHDVGDSKYSQEEQKDVINKFLKKLKGLNKYHRNEIIKISSNISLSKDNDETYDKNKIKTYIVQDADRINSLGSIGIMRYITYNMYKKHSFDDILSNMKRRTLKIKKFIRTASAKKIAKKHMHLIMMFINNYYQGF